MFFDICLCAKLCYAKTAACLSRDFLTNQNIVTLSWPAGSPDLAPIEHVWNILWRKVRSRNYVRTGPQMIAGLRCEWGAIAQSDISTINGLMFRWCTACMQADRDHSSN